MNTATTADRDRTFRTSTISVAAYLVAGRHLLLDRIDVDELGRAVFVFSDPNDSGERLQNDFLTQNALVPGAEFHRQLRTLRRLIDEKQSRYNRQYTNRGYEHGKQTHP